MALNKEESLALKLRFHRSHSMARDDEINFLYQYSKIHLLLEVSILW